MKCLYCGSHDSKVVDSRTTSDNASIRRRRECLVCKKRWTTYETVEQSPILVVKKNGSIQPFDKNKIVRGLIKACEKRPVSLEQIETISNSVEKQLKDSLRQEVEASEIGDMVLDRLKDIDQVSYIRFASVYHSFNDIESFSQFLRMI